MSDRRFHTDSRADENFTKDGLETLTGQPSRKWGRYVVKELVDNALEAVEEADTETPTITVDVELEGPHRDRISRVLPSPPLFFVSS
jgi:DNA topoisomerase VI subunit B